ncbi:MAG: SPOR domain-containing protein [Candidatus Hydrogenedentes bacterium]|nr:SPOR domain-containing protein [Candidatus Hydrogenedentota bacterium]
MPKLKQPKNPFFLEKLTEEFTSGQLVVGICFTLFIVMTAFILGYFVGHVDRPLTAPVQTADKVTEIPVAPADPAKTAPDKGKDKAEGKQTSPKLVKDAPEEESKMAKAATNPPPQQSGISQIGKPRVTELPPLPSPQQQAAATGAPVTVTKVPLPLPGEAAPVTADPAALPAPGEAEATAPAAAADPAGGGAKPVQVADTAPAVAVPAVPEDGEAPPLEALAPAADSMPSGASAGGARGTWGIQVASFQGADREKKAQDFQKRLKENASMNSEIFASEDQRYYRVLITGYADRAAAKAACDELKKRAGFADSFPRLLP